ncbi:purine and uridine phosphorylase [Aspergillus steynii IBT 23096]|uniref:Purine and uridine phosphorylase n=1 Tax=Aspergillus steynii IBT 23096 TaxID=1392250 RepID=A0A2I2G0M0_9EURO|nr:purine and uridine phosphorylase [Aspergillus steynii IBT 23096]PLB46413.1 purine and uridine phosphorylase [Aspergillus steynii IBT 23096]
MSRKGPSRGKYTVGWICALPIELAAAEAMLDKRYDDPGPEEGRDSDNDSNIYTLGAIGDHRVVIACLPGGQMGTNQAAVVAMQMKSRFKHLRFGLVVGIGGGVPSEKADIRLGDVVISQPDGGHGGVVQYDFGKTTPDGVKLSGYLNTPPPILLSALPRLRARHMRNKEAITKNLSKYTELPLFSRERAGIDELYKPAYQHAGGETCASCRKDKQIHRDLRRAGEEIMLHYGTIASGNQVMRDAIIRDRISSQIGGVLCFEMEAAGLMNSFPCLVIRGICDYADSHKNKRWQPYAAATAAACATEILSIVPAKDLAKMMTIDDAEVLRLAIERVSSDAFFSSLAILDQDQHRSNIPDIDPYDSRHFWVFKNIDFRGWYGSSASGALLLYGPPECCLDGISAYVIDQVKRVSSSTRIFYFSFATASSDRSLISSVVHTILNQLIQFTSSKHRMSVVKSFLHSLREKMLMEGSRINVDPEGSPKSIVQQILETSASEELWSSLLNLFHAFDQDFLLVIYDMDKARTGGEKFLIDMAGFIQGLVSRGRGVKVLITSRSQNDVQRAFSRSVSIEFDKERKGKAVPRDSKLY